MDGHEVNSQVHPLVDRPRDCFGNVVEFEVQEALDSRFLHHLHNFRAFRDEEFQANLEGADIAPELANKRTGFNDIGNIKSKTEPVLSSH
jgi:hypothetical protein